MTILDPPTKVSWLQTKNQMTFSSPLRLKYLQGSNSFLLFLLKTLYFCSMDKKSHDTVVIVSEISFDIVLCILDHFKIFEYRNT